MNVYDHDYCNSKFVMFLWRWCFIEIPFSHLHVHNDLDMIFRGKKSNLAIFCAECNALRADSTGRRITPTRGIKRPTSGTLKK